MSNDIKPLQDLRTSKWRIPIKVYQGKYKAWVGQNLILHYTDKTLPDFFKEKLAMINAYNNQGIVESEAGVDYEQVGGASMSILFPPGNAKFLRGVGWRINEWYYCVITPHSIRASLLGETISKNNLDEGDDDE